MTLSELEPYEQTSLLALLGLMARLDGWASEEEQELLRRIGSELGEGNFARAAAEVARLADDDAVLATAERVTRQDAREVIYELLWDMAVKESIVEPEAKLLDRLATTWSLPRVAGEDEE
jgi:hypothetical protein